MQLLWIIGVAAAIGAAGVAVLKKLRVKSIYEDDYINYEGKPYTKQLIPGALIQGVGWGLAAACPGTVP